MKKHFLLALILTLVAWGIAGAQQTLLVPFQLVAPTPDASNSRTKACCAAHDSSPEIVGTALEGPELEKLLPKSQYQEGDNFPVQARNAGGVRLANGKRILAALVDTSGFSSQAQSKYLGMLILEQAVELGTSRVPAGAYGWGRDKDGIRFYDVGGNSVASSHLLRDEGIAPVKPLQVALRHGGIRIYAGKEYFVLWPIAGR